MIKVEIDNKSIQLPEQFTVAQWEAMMLWDFEEPKHWPRILEAALGIEEERFKDSDPKGIELAMVFIISTMNKRFPIKGVDLNKMTFGQWVDLDVYVNIGIDKNLQNMLDVLESPIIYSGEALSQIEQYVMWRTSIYRQYKTLFGLNDKDFEEWSEDADDNLKDPMSIARGWYKIIVDLANENLLNIDAVTDEPLKKVLNFMALQKEKKLAEAEQIRKQRQLVR